MSYNKSMKEIWKDIEGYEGKYQISNLGKVKSLNYRRSGYPGVLKTENNGNGYFALSLCKNGVTEHLYVHRLVAKAFITNPDNLPEVNHKKEFETDNNCVDNLEWCNRKYNVNYGTRTQRQMDTRAGFGGGKPKLLEDVSSSYISDPLWFEKDDYTNPYWYFNQEIECLKEFNL